MNLDIFVPINNSIENGKGILFFVDVWSMKAHPRPASTMVRLCLIVSLCFLLLLLVLRQLKILQVPYLENMILNSDDTLAFWVEILGLFYTRCAFFYKKEKGNFFTPAAYFPGLIPQTCYFKMYYSAASHLLPVGASVSRQEAGIFFLTLTLQDGVTEKRCACLHHKTSAFKQVPFAVP